MAIAHWLQVLARIAACARPTQSERLPVASYSEPSRRLINRASRGKWDHRL